MAKATAQSDQQGLAVLTVLERERQAALDKIKELERKIEQARLDTVKESKARFDGQWEAVKDTVQNVGKVDSEWLKGVVNTFITELCLMINGIKDVDPEYRIEAPKDVFDKAEIPFSPVQETTDKILNKLKELKVETSTTKLYDALGSEPNKQTLTKYLKHLANKNLVTVRKVGIENLWTAK